MLPPDAPPMPTSEADLVARLLAEAGRLTGEVSLALSFARGGAGRTLVATLMRLFLRPAETLARRAFLLLASWLPRPATASRAALPSHRPRAEGRGCRGAPRRPAFRLDDAAPRLRAPPGVPAEATPRVEIPGLDRPGPLAPPSPASGPGPAAALAERRLAALLDALRDPVATARRIVRRADAGRTIRLNLSPVRRPRPVPGFRPAADTTLIGEANRVLSAWFADSPDGGLDTS